MATVGVKIRVFVPKTVFNEPEARRAIQHTMIQKTAPDIRREFEKTVRTWDHQPNWTVHQYSGVRVMWIKVLTYSTQYRLVTAGASPHNIIPRKARFLSFRSQFRPKTRPRVIGSFAGGKSGNFVHTYVVHHPGHKAREFDREIAEQYAPVFQADIQEAIAKGIVHA